MAGLLNPLAFLNGVSDLVLSVLLTVLVAIPTQGFFVHRIYLFSGKNIVAPLIWVCLAIAQLASVIIYLAKALYSANGLQVLSAAELSENPFRNILTLNLSIVTGVDVLIAIFLTFLLLRKRTTATFAGTAYTLQRLTVFAVNTGIWSATFALLTMILLHVFPLNLLYCVSGIPLCSVYCNTLLANLNAREYIRGSSTTHYVDADLFSSSSLPVSKSTKDDKQGGEPKVVTSVQGIWKTTEVEMFPDSANPVHDIRDSVCESR